MTRYKEGTFRNQILFEIIQICKVNGGQVARKTIKHEPDYSSVNSYITKLTEGQKQTLFA
ncbi:MAG: hypothetical protein N2517_08065 [Ignavibacteria bacterium]|nr:hypothetical protein [Ignavibacteria bacterium]